MNVRHTVEEKMVGLTGLHKFIFFKLCNLDGRK